MIHGEKKYWSHPISKELKTLIYRKHRCWTRYQETRDKKYLNEFKHIRNKVRKKTRIITQIHQDNIAKSCKNNSKKFWQHVRSKTSNKTCIGDIVTTQDNVKNTISGNSEKAKVFSE